MAYFVYILLVVAIFIAYRVHVMSAHLRRSIDDLVDIQEVVVSKLDKIAAVLQDFPQDLRRQHDSIKRDEKKAKAAKIRRKKVKEDGKST